MHRTAKKGNVAAQKAYMALDPQLSAPPVPKEAPKAGAKGKKEQANEDAVEAQTGTEWNDLLPRNVVPIRGT
jgi:hypothetical protein